VIKDNRLKSALKLLFGNDALLCMPYGVEPRTVLEKNNVDNNLVFNESISQDIKQILANNISNKDIIIFTTKRFSSIGSIFSKKNFIKVDEYIVIPSFENPRWVVPAGIYNIGEMIQASSLKARVAIQIFKILSFSHMGGLVFPNKIRRFSISPNERNGLLSKVSGDYPYGTHDRVIYLGSFGPLQKTTVEFVEAGQAKFYAKTADNYRAKESLKNEKMALDFINTLTLKKLIAPTDMNLSVKNSSDFAILFQSSLAGGKPSVTFSHLIAEVITELHEKTLKSDVEGFVDIVKGLHDRLVEKENSLENLNSLQQNILRKAKYESDYLFNNIANLPAYLSFSHGDFTRWNIREDDCLAYVFDWEEAKFRPVGYDFFHYLLIDSILVKNNLSVSSYFNKVIDTLTNNPMLMNVIFKGDKKMMVSYLRLYLIDIVDIYLWHAIIHSEEGYPVKGNIDQILTFVLNLFSYLDHLKNEI
jgi:hypothetical protein